MCGDAERQATIVLELKMESFVPHDHAPRRLKPRAHSEPLHLSSLFGEIYAACGRTSIPPEHQRKASLLMESYTIRYER